MKDEVKAKGKMVKDGLLQEEGLKCMSADIVGIIADYMPYTLDQLPPQHRIQLADRCFAKLAIEKAKPPKPWRLNWL